MRAQKIFRIFLLFILWIASCKSSPDLITTTEGMEKLPYSVAVIFSEELVRYREKWSLELHSMLYKKGIVEPQYFSVGDSLSASLFMRVSSIFQTARILDESDPSAKNYNIVLKFSIQREKCGLVGSGGNFDIDFKDFPDDGIRSRSLMFDIVVVIEVYDGIESEPLNRKLVKGSGIYRRDRKVKVRSGEVLSPTMMGMEKRKNRLEKAINDAINNVDKKVIKVLSDDFLEPNTKVEIKTKKKEVELIINFKFLSTQEEYAVITIKSVPSFENLRFGIPADSNLYNLDEFNKRLSEYYVKKGDEILIINKNTGIQEPIKIKWPSGLSQNTLSINISKQLKKTKILK